MSVTPRRRGWWRVAAQGPGRYALVAVLVLVGVVGARPPAAHADEPDIRLTLTALTGVIGPGRDDERRRDLGPDDVEPGRDDLGLRVLVENAGPEPVSGLQVVVEVHPAVTDRTELAAALAGNLTTTPLHVHTHPVRPGRNLGPGDLAGVEDRFTPGEIGWGPEVGVHPVRISALLGVRPVAEVMTSVVWVGIPPASRVLTTLVWPIDDVPWRTADGAYPVTVDPATRPGSRLDVLVATLERQPTAPVVLAPAAHLLEDLQDRADGFTALQRQPDGSLESRPVEPEDPPARAANDLLQRLRALATTLPYAPVVGTYGDADLVALTGSGSALTGLAGEAAVESRPRAQRLLDRRVDGATHLVTASLDDAAAELLPGDQVLLPAHAVTETSAATSPTAADADAPDPALARSLPAIDSLRPVRTATGRVLTGLVADPYASAVFTTPDPAGPVAQLQELVAVSALHHLAVPNLDGRIHVLLPPPTWDPHPELAAQLADTLLSLPWVTPADPTTLTSEARRSAAPLELAPAAVLQLEDPLRPELDAALADLDALTQALPADAALDGGRSVSSLRDQLLRSTSSWFRADAVGEAEALVRDVRRSVDDRFGEVVVVGGARVTLTSDSGVIPVTLQRPRGGAIAVVVEVESPGRLVWPDGRRSEVLVLAENTSATLSFPTRALSTGTFPVTVRVLDPSGHRELDRASLSVRSTAVSGPALSVTAGLVLVLLLAGSLRTRRPRPPHLESV